MHIFIDRLFKYRIAWAAVGTLAIACQTGCVASKVSRNLSNTARVQERELIELASRIDHEPREVISWPSALDRLYRDNLSLQISKKQLEDSKKQTMRQWLSLVPTFSTFLSVGESISEISNITSANVNANLVANLNIPNPFEFHAALYALALQQQNAIWSHELDRRRAHIELYSTYLEEAQIAEAERELEKLRRDIANAPSSELLNVLRNLDLQQTTLKRRSAYQRLRMNQLLQTPGKNWEPKGKLPAVSYRNRFEQISIGERFGKLALNLQTIQIESSILQVRRVRFQQWPTFNFSLSAPPIYSTNDASGFSSDRLLFFGGANKSFDVADPIGRDRIRDAVIRAEFTREQLRNRMESELVRIRDGQEAYRRMLQEEGILITQLKRLENSSNHDMDALRKDLNSMAELKANLSAVKNRIQQLELQFLIWDEEYWSH